MLSTTSIALFFMVISALIISYALFSISCPQSKEEQDKDDKEQAEYLNQWAQNKKNKS